MFYYFHPGGFMIQIFTDIFGMGWNHQVVNE